MIPGKRINKKKIANMVAHCSALIKTVDMIEDYSEEKKNNIKDFLTTIARDCSKELGIKV